MIDPPASSPAITEREVDPALSEDPGPFDRPTLIRQTFADEPTRFGQMVGRSAPMRQLFALLQRAAMSDATILIEGETGTGKEASAEAIHAESQRSQGPFVVIDCGAIPSQLLESELFGNERGAFTGAVSARAGAFEVAHGGSIFLDEIGELSLDLQPKILRVLERKQIKRVGSNNYHAVDVRVIAATNRSLKAEVAANRFRSDLYYRLAVVQVKLPPLRERVADLSMLVDHILSNLGIGHKLEAGAMRTPEFIAKLSSYRWPGNIRQWRNYIERCVALGEASTPPALETIPPPNMAGASGAALAIDATQPLRLARENWVASFERRYLEASLARHHNNVSAAARTAGVDRIHFYRLLWKHGLRAHEPESGGAKR